tara:strand:- start:151 stop:507 length:357 start_codon:yes stop_codon:yes gene_type:complete
MNLFSKTFSCLAVASSLLAGSQLAAKADLGWNSMGTNQRGTMVFVRLIDFDGSSRRYERVNLFSNGGKEAVILSADCNNPGHYWNRHGKYRLARAHSIKHQEVNLACGRNLNALIPVR